MMFESDVCLTPTGGMFVRPTEDPFCPYYLAELDITLAAGHWCRKMGK